MSSDLSQFEIPGGQLLVTNSKPKVDIRTDIGEAKITHTIFGRAKVRVVRQQDKIRRAGLLVTLLVVVITVLSWRGWMALQQMKNAAIPLSETVRVTAPVFQPEYIPAPAAIPSAGNKPGTPIPTEINKLIAAPNSAPQQQPDLKTAASIAAKPVAAQPLTASKPQMAPLATNNIPAKNPTVVQQPRKPLPPRRAAAPVVAKPSATKPVAPTVVAKPSAEQSITSTVTTPAKQPATSKPAEVAPPVQPSSKENTSTTAPAITNQSLDPVNAQPQVNKQP